MAESIQEYQVKAAYLVNFPRLVIWPEASFKSPASPIVFCLLGGGKISETVKDTIDSKTLKGRKLEVKMGSSLLDQCHIIFIGKDRKMLAELVFSATEGKDILVVGDFEEFTKIGGMVGFSVKSNRVNISIDLTAVLDTNLKLGAKLIKIATIIF